VPAQLQFAQLPLLLPYPAGWHIRVAALALQLDVRPLLADQELAKSYTAMNPGGHVANTRARREEVAARAQQERSLDRK
jgi:hypothetical protein